MDRHLTVSGFVVHEAQVALHWHRKLGAWLPAGGHLEPGEDPLQAALREVREEFALEAEAAPLARRVAYEGGPYQIEPPFTILNCYPAPEHEHVDCVYFLRHVSGYPGRCYDPEYPIQWLDRATIDSSATLTASPGLAAPLAPDVRALALEAIRLVSKGGNRV